MPKRPDSSGAVDRVVLIFLFALVLMASPLIETWAADANPWYLPYLGWGLVIGLAAWRQRGAGSDEL